TLQHSFWRELRPFTNRDDRIKENDATEIRYVTRKGGFLYGSFKKKVRVYTTPVFRPYTGNLSTRTGYVSTVEPPQTYSEYVKYKDNLVTHNKHYNRFYFDPGYVSTVEPPQTHSEYVKYKDADEMETDLPFSTYGPNETRPTMPPTTTKDVTTAHVTEKDVTTPQVTEGDVTTPQVDLTTAPVVTEGDVTTPQVTEGTTEQTVTERVDVTSEAVTESTTVTTTTPTTTTTTEEPSSEENFFGVQEDKPTPPLVGPVNMEEKKRGMDLFERKRRAVEPPKHFPVEGRFGGQRRGFFRQAYSGGAMIIEAMHLVESNFRRTYSGGAMRDRVPVERDFRAAQNGGRFFRRAYSGGKMAPERRRRDADDVDLIGKDLFDEREIEANNPGGLQRSAGIFDSFELPGGKVTANKDDDGDLQSEDVKDDDLKSDDKEEPKVDDIDKDTDKDDDEEKSKKDDDEAKDDADLESKGE
ncbi:uncharacterized protein LOC103515317, partial [Diaphorina citri]|uniref:Uncharacterized protein LOC103515317 n=1 Tax=Diaphorina citri TaxID=121845 RepID=A0A1S3DCZ9_DIACI